MIGASEAFSKALMGLRNTIDPTQKLQMEDVSVIIIIIVIIITMILICIN
jgi:hypothetical protein